MSRQPEKKLFDGPPDAVSVSYSENLKIRRNIVRELHIQVAYLLCAKLKPINHIFFHSIPKTDKNTFPPVC